MLYPTVTEKPVRLEPVGHDPFIDGLDDRIRQLSKEVEGQGI